MTIYVIKTTDVRDTDGKRFTLYLDLPHPSIDDLAADLRGGPVAGKQLHTVRQADDSLLIEKTTPYLLTSSVIYAAFPADKTFVVKASDGTPA